MPKQKSSKAVPRSERPQIPDYGISKSKTGLLPWKWAEKNLSESREYWMMTVRPDGRPHAMIIWGLWVDGAFWFGTGRNTQKARNLANNPNCIVGTQNAAEAVILEGVAELVTDKAIEKIGAGIGSQVQDERRRVGACLSSTSKAGVRTHREDVSEDGDAVDVRVRPLSKSFPQRLKPIELHRFFGRTEVVPFPFLPGLNSRTPRES